MRILRSTRAADGSAKWDFRRRAAMASLLAIWALTAVGLARVELDTGVDAFVPNDDPTYKALVERDEKFGSDPVVVALEADSPKGFLLEQDQLPRLLGLEGELAGVADVAGVYGPATALNQTAKGLQGLISRISGERDALMEAVRRLARERGATRAEAERAARLGVVRFDRRYGALIAKALPVGLPTLRNQVFVGNVVFDDHGEAKPQWRFLVPDNDRVTLLVRPRAGLDQDELADVISEVRRVIERSDLGIARTRVGGVPVVTAAVAEEARSEIPMLGAVALGIVGLILVIVPWTRHRTARLRPIVCALTGAGATVAAFGWLDRPMSLGTVAFLPILFGVGTDYPVYLSSAVQRRSVAAVAAAGSAAFGSLWLADLPLVRELGMALAVGVLLTVGAAFLFAIVWGQSSAGRNVLQRREGRDASGREASRMGRLWSRRPRVAWPGGSSSLFRHDLQRWQRGALVLAAGGVAAVGWVCLGVAEVETSPNSLARGVPELEETQALGDDLGFAGEVDVVIRGDDVISPDAIRWARDAESTIVRKHGDTLTPVISLGRLMSFLGERPTAGEATAAADVVPPYLLSSVASDDRGWGVIVSGISVTDVDEQAAVLSDVRAALPAAPVGFEGEVVGLPVVAARSLELVRADRLWINATAALAAVACLLVFLPNRRDAFRAGAAVLLAGGWVFGLARLVWGDLSPLTVAVGALVTVTAAEFTVMLLQAARRASPAIRRSTLTAAVAGIAGYLVLLGSSLSVLQEFGALSACGVLLSLVAAQVIVLFDPPATATFKEATGAGRTSLQPNDAETETVSRELEHASVKGSA